MAVILCLETATTNCSVALAIDGKVVAAREENSKQYSHAEKLHVFISDVFKEAGIDKNKLDAIAVSKGPGSYTGLRIGVSAAKGLSFALGKPVVAIGTLDVLAQQGTVQDGFIIPLLDARRMEVYSAVYDGKKNLIRETKAEILDEQSFKEFLDQGKCVFLGDGASKLEAICSHSNAHFLSEKFPSAEDMLVLAENKIKVGDFEDVAYFEPFYLKEFIPGK